MDKKENYFRLVWTFVKILVLAQVVYSIRDPRDVCMSYYHHCKTWAYEGYEGSLEEFVEAFLRGGSECPSTYVKKVLEILNNNFTHKELLRMW